MTLLEVMLVLAIAALIIVMSIRYFRSASISQQANAFVSMVEAIAATENSLSQGTANYVNGSTLTNVLGSNSLALPWGGVAVVEGFPEYFVIKTLNMPAGVCNLVISQLGAGIYNSQTTWQSSNWQVGSSGDQPPCYQIYYVPYPKSNR